MGLDSGLSAKPSHCFYPSGPDPLVPRVVNDAVWVLATAREEFTGRVRDKKLIQNESGA